MLYLSFSSCQLLLVLFVYVAIQMAQCVFCVWAVCNKFENNNPVYLHCVYGKDK